MGAQYLSHRRGLAEDVAFHMSEGLRLISKLFQQGRFDSVVLFWFTCSIIFFTVIGSLGKLLKVFSWFGTASAVGGNDAGGCEHPPSHSKGKDLVPMQPRKKKVGAWKRAMVWFLEGGHEEIVAAGFSLRSLADILAFGSCWLQRFL